MGDSRPFISDLVIVVWMDVDDDAAFHALAYNSGRGRVRVYVKDATDPRSHDGGQPYFNDPFHAVRWMADHRKKTCQVSLKTAVDLGWSIEEFDPAALRACVDFPHDVDAGAAAGGS